MKRSKRLVYIVATYLFLIGILSVVVYNGLAREKRLMAEVVRAQSIRLKREVEINNRVHVHKAESDTKPRPESILMLNVIKGNDTSKYKTALASQECYAKMHGYQFKVASAEHFDKCQQKDNIMFKRHCVVVQLLPAYDYIIFLDADMAVVSFNKKWEEYIDPRFDITFYERFFNWEFAAGSYIAKNSDWTIDFLTRFANYESQLPNSFHGRDNGALHIFLGMEMYPELDGDFDLCREIYKKSENYTTLFQYEACVRSIMGSRGFSKNILISKKAKGWVRDIWLTDSRWNPERDFLLHALQEQNIIEDYKYLVTDRPRMGNGTLLYYSPFLTIPEPAQCSSKGYKVDLDTRLIVRLEMVNELLQKVEENVEKKRYESLGSIVDYFTEIEN